MVQITQSESHTKVNLFMDLFSFLQDYTLLAGASALILALYFLSLVPKTAKHRVVPEASGAWPIVGHFNLFRGSSDLPHRALAAMAEKYGPIFMVRLGIHKVLIVHSWQVAKEIFTTHDVHVSSRPKFLAAKILGYNYGMFGFTPYGPYWREIRRIVSLELLSSRRLEQLKHVPISELDNSIKNLYKLWREKRDEQKKVLVEMKKWFGELNINVILRMVAGKRYSGATSSEEEKEMKRSREVMRDFFHFLGLFVAADALPFLGWLDLGGHEKAMKRVAKEIDIMTGKWLEEHRIKRNSQEAVEDKDFIDVMISAVETEGLKEYDSDTIIKSTVMVLIASSADTTTVMLTWTLSLLLNNPHALKKAQEELDRVVGRDRQVNESDITNLVYLQAVVKETLRLYPAGRLGGQRVFSEDCTVAGYHVPKGTWLMVNVWKLQQDPEIWSNPSEFRPERFLDENHNHVDVKGAHFELIPFGAGRRSCPGIALALQLLHLVLATLLQHFDIGTPGGAPVDMAETAGLTNAKSSPLEVLMSPRMSTTIW
ncbi:putative cytochrome P450 [Helianthus annuus]|uniref:Cytochrome P450 n=1 Tax=Helianthus annuus TaxID=4232 RepID=A0A251U022_HELAN|nr:cytochrome P450 CYP82D47 [Helianthus annuus]KAF5792417.1 putative cytochrome P450 [Helianthus annuus]KAJ0527363.1 putative cytochrome P450 [Helianthus annuus]KAJ0543765.1 putative cytochrome P450 [Helianthus annuus]KAJ0708819.1 putative cytochrome P450 [Helianthus annuus]KAJ0889892.1 putative cytochrome P450 [Helianthus annuus]